MNRQRERSASVPCASLARASPSSLGDAEVFIPLPRKDLLVGDDQLLHFWEFRRSETSASGQPHWIQPEPGTAGVALDVHVNRFLPIGRIEEDPVGPTR
jgi:hypothetical protein